MGLLGLDIGTTGCKATIIDFNGNKKTSAYREYSLENPGPGLEELNPEKVWNSVQQVIRKTTENYQGKEIKAISISSFGEAAVPLDSKGNVLYNSIMYIDKRGEEEIKQLKQNLNEKEVLQITGTSIHPMYTLGKLMWLKKHKPKVYNKTRKFLLYADFILYKLGGEPVINYSLASRTMAFDVINKKWSGKILNTAGIDKNKLPEPVPSGSIIGQISKTQAAKLDLPEKVLLVAGGHDQPCAALGAGIIKNGIAVDGMGTVECITPAFKQPIISKQMAEANLVCCPHVKDDMYVTYAFNFTGGSLLKWYRDNFGYEEKQLAQKRGADVYDILIEKAAKQPTDIYILPHFAGSGTPYMDTESRGAIIGITMETGKKEIIKAVLEGITYEMMINLECLDQAGVEVNELRAVGGGAKSDYWLQLKANMMGKKIVSLNITEAGTLGVAMLAGTAAGIYNSLEEAVDKLVKIKKEFYPDKEKYQLYQQKFEIYKKIYPGIKNILNS
ncbi:MAG: FGGY-family carbohydrate kinase [Bacillota bacterium]